MAKIILQGNPVKVTAPDANDNELIIQIDNAKNYGYMTAFIKVVSGTIQFNVGTIVDANDQPSYTSSDTVPPIQIGGDYGTLHFKATAFGAVFNIGLA